MRKQMMQRSGVAVGHHAENIQQAPAIHAPEPDAMTIACYRNQIPDFSGAELERLYANPFSSLAYLRITGKLDAVNTYVVRRDRDIVTLFLFRIEGGTVRVLNEVIRIEQQDIERFAHYVFSAFAAAQVIVFRAVRIDLRALPFVHQRFNYLEDIVLDLPATEKQYTAALGKNTRRNMRRYATALAQDMPSFAYRSFSDQAVREQDVRDVIALNHARMSGKGKVFGIDAKRIEHIVSLVRQSGMVGIATIDGRVAGGTIAYRIGRNYFLLVLAHDPQYNAHGLGALCCYLTICESIRQGGAEFHFLWGRYDYKYAFGARLRDLDYLALYRSRVQMLRHPVFALNAWTSAIVRQAMLRLHRAKQKDTALARLAFGAMTRMRQLRDALRTLYRR